MEVERVFLSIIAGIAFIAFAYFQYRRKEFLTSIGPEKKSASPVSFYVMISIWIIGAIYIFISLFNELKAVGFKIIY